MNGESEISPPSASQNKRSLWVFISVETIFLAVLALAIYLVLAYFNVLPQALPTPFASNGPEETREAIEEAIVIDSKIPGKTFVIENEEELVQILSQEGIFGNTNKPQRGQLPIRTIKAEFSKGLEIPVPSALQFRADTFIQSSSVVNGSELKVSFFLNENQLDSIPQDDLWLVFLKNIYSELSLAEQRDPYPILNLIKEKNIQFVVK